MPTAHGARYVSGGSRGADPAPVVTDRLRRSAQKLLERLARVVEPFRMQPGAYNFCQWRQVITPQIVGSENGQTTGTKKPARGGLSVPVCELVAGGIFQRLAVLVPAISRPRHV